jgi:hypothetical protein
VIIRGRLGECFGGPVRDLEDLVAGGLVVVWLFSGLAFGNCLNREYQK